MQSTAVASATHPQPDGSIEVMAPNRGSLVKEMVPHRGSIEKMAPHRGSLVKETAP